MPLHTLHTIEALEARIAPAAVYVNTTTAKYTDVDGDHVVVKFSKPILQSQSTVDTAFKTAAGSLGDQLQGIDLSPLGLPATDNGLSITITAAPFAGLGDGHASVGYIKGGSLALGSVTVPGDLTEITAGDLLHALKSLTVGSLGIYGGGTGASTAESDLYGAVGSIVVKGNVSGEIINTHAAGLAGSIGSIKIGGSMIGNAVDNTGSIEAGGPLGSVSIGGDLVGSGGKFSGSIVADSTVGTIFIGGSVIGSGGDDSGEIKAASIKSVSIGGSLRGAGGRESGEVDVDGTLSALSVRGSILGAGGPSSGTVSATLLSALKIGGDLRGGDGGFSGSIDATNAPGALTIAGSIIGEGPFSGEVDIQGQVGPITIGHDIRGGYNLSAGAIFFANGGSLTVGGSIIGGTGGESGFVEASGNGTLKSVVVGGDIVGGLAGTGVNSNGELEVNTVGTITIGGSVYAGTNPSNAATPTGNGAILVTKASSVTVKGSLVGFIDGNNVINTARLQGSGAAPGSNGDVVFGVIKIGGSVKYANILAGFDASGATSDGDAQIGSVSVGGDWIASNLVSGVGNLGQDQALGGTGNNQDNVNFGDANDFIPNDGNHQHSKIGSVVIGGQVLGTATSMGNVSIFGFAALNIGSFTIGATHLKLKAGMENDAISLGITGNVSLSEFGLS